MNAYLHPLLLVTLWLGLNGFTVFILQLCLGIHASWPTLVVSLGTLVFLLYKNKSLFGLQDGRSLDPRLKHSRVTDSLWAWVVLGIIALFTTLHSLHYPLGGWDAWSCWNLKAKFIYLGGDRFKDMFDPLLWRSNTQYPLLLPSINAWFWGVTGGAHTWGPMVMSITFTVLTASILLFSIAELTRRKALACLISGAVFLLPFNTTLSAGQYSDILVGLFLLCSFICFIKKDLKLMCLFLGLLSFTKTEGTVAAGILVILLFFYHRDLYKNYIVYLALALVPIIIFTFWMAPHNEAFVNGLLSLTKPSSWQRLQTIITYPFLEIISLKWNGLWIILLIGVIARWRHLAQKRLQIFGIFFAVFFSILLMYYQVNTFFEIRWWLDTTLHRILFMLMPSLFLWWALALETPNKS